MLSAIDVFPTDGRAARMIRSDGWRPPSSASSCESPVGTPRIWPRCSWRYSSRSYAWPRRIGERLEAAIRAPLADLEEDRLGAVDRDLGVVRLLVADRRDLARGADEVAQHRLALDDPAVVLGVDGGRDRVHQAGQVGRTADLVEPVAPAQLVAEGHEVDRLALTVEREHRLVDVARAGRGRSRRA